MGVRGVGPRKAAGYGRNFGEYVRTANDETVVVAQIETKESVENLDEILSVKGIDVAFVGRTDLTVSLGLLDDRGNPKVTDAMKRVVGGCDRHGKLAGTLALSVDEATEASSLGFRFIALGSDIRFLGEGARSYLGLLSGRAHRSK